MKSDRANNTIIKQLVTGLGCLLIGGGLISGLILWANTWGIQFSDGSGHDFWVTGWFGYVSLVFIVGLVTHLQFEEALTSQKVFWKSLKYSIFPCALALFLFGSLTLLSGEFDVLKGEIAIIVAIFGSIGLTVGSIQTLRLQLENFDPKEHRFLISNDVDVEACRKNLLSYRHKVVGFWRVFWLVISCCLLVVALLLVITSQNSGWGVIALLLIGLLTFTGYATSQQLDFLQDRQFIKIDGEIRKKSWSTGRGVHLGLICNNQKLFLDNAIWEQIIDGQNYTLWYSRYGIPTGSNFVGRVLAFEHQFYRVKPNNQNSAELASKIFRDVGGPV